MICILKVKFTIVQELAAYYFRQKKPPKMGGRKVV